MKGKKFAFKDFQVIEYNSKQDYKKDSEELKLNIDKSITVFTRYRGKNGKFKTEIYNI